LSSQVETAVGEFPNRSGISAFLLLAGRVALAFVFLLSGIGKAGAPGATIAYIASTGLPFAEFALVAAILIEIGGGTLLILGFLTRPVALALAAFTVMTALIFHADFGDRNQLIHFAKNIGIAGGFLQVAVFGAGALSLDAWLRARRQ
jgi:putative oxidoreductase